jgi:hypothetical protein
VRLLAIAVVIVASSSLARAEERLEVPEVPRKPSLKVQVTRNLTLLGDELGFHLSTLTADLVRFRFDFEKKYGRFKVGGGGDSFLFQLDGDVEVHGSVARIRSRLDLGLGGERLSLDLPEMDLATQTVAGERAVELRLPIFEGRF